MHRAIDPADLDPGDRHKMTVGSIVPRPVAWTTTVNADGLVNLAPFSYFMGCQSYVPALAVSIGSRDGGAKDTRANILASGEFVVNMVTEDLARDMVATAAAFPPGVSELDHVDVTAVPSIKVAPPRIAESPLQMECRVLHALDLGDPPRTSTLFVGRIVMWHVRPDLVDDDYHIRQDALHPIARLGGPHYAALGAVYRMNVPPWREVAADTPGS